ncbi:cardiolipin synthase [Acidaminobacter hydrogenoformans]|uniref:Cardiolipin synthase n=1 Tax=Acidaminobacter hydrogenoformans DSM 2784 TaxID=1120920 RepID=A0A1G5RQ81_9FIRM|nr:cardiolipin synthase [Acidaminobacter hydrogenoformans]SCZ76164.1 cardiolipin synthetase 2 [Acidaminobacter hydrogenoformans DSM 2784]
MDKLIRRSVVALVLAAVGFLIYEAYILLIQSTFFEQAFLAGLRTFINWGFAIYIFLIGIVILVENKNPSKTISWLLVLYLLPFVGFVFYILFGGHYRERYRTKQKRSGDYPRSNMENAAEIQKEIMDYIELFRGEEDAVNNRMVNLLLKNSNAPFTINNKIEVLTNGEATFDRIFERIRAAKAHVHVEFFIIRNDELGNDFKDLLIQKAREGVAVRLIYDSVGCWKLGKAYIEALKNGGVEVYPFFPVTFPVLSRELNYRNHRKIVIVDGHTGFLGGHNVGDEYLGKMQLGFWRDTHIMMEGEAVYSLQDVFLNDWAFVSGKDVKPHSMFPKLANYGETMTQVISSGPDSDWKTILQAYFVMISSAEDRIWIASPYLVPEESIRMGLITAALSGVDVRIIIPSKPDHFFVFWSTQDNLEELLEAGVKVYEYQKGFIHSKILLMDGVAASVGTANLDIRSLEMNFEVNAFIYDPQVVRRLEEDFYKDMENSTLLCYEAFKKRPFRRKLLEAVGRLVSPLQ